MTIARISRPAYTAFPSLINRFFEGEMMDREQSNYAADNATMPAVNIIESTDDFKIEVAAPGMSKEDFNVNYENGELTISSEKQEENMQNENERFTRREFNYQSFRRTFTIAEKVVDADKISARYENGVLYLTLPKREEVKPKPSRHIEIA